MNRTYFLRFVLLTAALVAGAPAARSADGSAFDEEYLQREGVGTDAAALLAWLRGQTATSENQQRVQELIAQLGSESFEERESATRELIATGPFAVPLLRDAANHADAEIARRIHICGAGLNAGNRPALNTAAVRALLRLGPPETTKALLAFLPDAHDDMLEEEIIYGLYAVAQRAGKIEPVLLDACADPHPLRRAAAACIIGRLGNAEERDRVAGLLRDTDAEVRLRAAQGLLAAGDKRGLSTLVALLETPTLPAAWQAEELLRYVAGETAPDVIVGMGEAKEQRICRHAWQRWLRRHEAEIDAERLANGARRPGLFMAYERVLPPPPEGEEFYLRVPSYQLALYGCDGRPRNKPVAESLGYSGRYSSDFVTLKVGHVFGVSANSTLVTVSDLAGRTLWSWDLNDSGATSCQRLPGGRFLVSWGDRLWVFAADGSLSSKHVFDDLGGRGIGSLQDARILGHDRVACAFQNGRVLEIDLGSHKVIRESQMQAISPADYADPHGRTRTSFIIRKRDQFLEIDPRGKTTRELRVGDAYRVCRLASGNFLVHFADDSRRVVEMDADGKLRSEVFLDNDVTIARPVFDLLRLGFDRPCEVDVPSVANRMQGLHSPLARVRRGSAVMLDKLGPAALPALADLGALLNDESAVVRQQARAVLMKIGPEAIRVAVPALSADRPLTRVSAAVVVGHYGPLAAVAVPELLANLRHKDSNVRKRAAEALVQIEPDRAAAEDAVIAASADAELLSTLSGLLARWAEESPKSMNALLAGIRSSNSSTRFSTALSLGRVRRKDERIVPALVTLLADSSPHVRYWVIEAIAARGGEARGAVKALLELANQYDPEDTDVNVRSQSPLIAALRAAAALDPKAAKPLLVSLVYTPEVAGRVRSECCELLTRCALDRQEMETLLQTTLEGNIKGYGARALVVAHGGPHLHASLRAEYRKWREQQRHGDLNTLLASLQANRAAATSLLPELIATLSKESDLSATQQKLLPLLGTIGPDAAEALPGLLRLHAKHEYTAAPWALARIAPKDKKVLAVLQETIRSPKVPSNIRAAAAEALNETGSAGRDLLVAVLHDLTAPDNAAVSQQSDYDYLVNVLKSEYWHGPDACFNTSQDSRVAVIMSLGVMGADAATAVGKLQKLADAAATPPAVRLAAVWTLGRIGADAAPAAPALSGVLRDVSLPYAMRVEASRSLTAVGPGAVPSLVKALEDRDWAARLLSLKSLETLSARSKLTLPAVEAIAGGPDPLLARAAQAVCGQTTSARKDAKPAAVDGRAKGD